MAAAIAFRRVNKECFHRLAALRSISPAVHAPPLPPQSSVGIRGSCHPAENVQKICSQSACQLRQGGPEEEKRRISNLKLGFSGQQRWYAGSNSEKAKPDADSIATEMIKYAASCRNQEAAHGEAIRVLEQGKIFLLSGGSSAATATGRVLLTLATFYVDRVRLSDAVDALQVASDLESAGLELRVAALEALVGVCLRLQQEEAALRYAHSCGQLVVAASDTVPNDELLELEYRGKAVAALAALVCARCGAADSKLFEDIPAWLGESSRGTAGVGAALFSIAQCAHVGGSLKIAGELYERVIAIIQNSKELSEVTLASVAMAPNEVHIGALAGLGQLASHMGDFNEAERKITEALAIAEKINGDKHPRVGVILACLADVYTRRGKSKAAGEYLLFAEGLYRRCEEYLGSPSVDASATGSIVDLVDIISLSRARYAEIVSKFPNREKEAEKLMKWASTMWKGPRPLADLMKVDGAQRLVAKEKTMATECSQAAETQTSLGKVEGYYVVVDVRLGRVIWKV